MGEMTEAQKRAHKTYIEKFARMEIRVSPEQRDVIQAHATANGESVNAFICRAIQAAIEQDEGKRAGG